MKYAQIRKLDIANGEGVRTSLFVSGCTLNCNGCFNKEYQNFNYGLDFNKEVEKLILSYLKNEYISGLTILGGEPLEQTMDNALYDLIINTKKTNKNIWIYTGYKFEDILKDNKKIRLIENCDILVDGIFDEELRDLTLKFRGSRNQRIIDVKKSLNSKKIIEYKVR